MRVVEGVGADTPALPGAITENRSLLRKAAISGYRLSKTIHTAGHGSSDKVADGGFFSRRAYPKGRMVESAHAGDL